ncbi:ubiquitin-like modifier-activating enzyme 1 [Magallana gigas]|uniref:ubiquitin-like modifier-activating enzyme 1 n=1 Tax=Magallana gigas TaxID=29159 RepID=UPI0033411132
MPGSRNPPPPLDIINKPQTLIGKQINTLDNPPPRKIFMVVVLTNSNLEEKIRIGEICHKNNIKFISVDSRGLFVELFCDFGDNFVMNDVDGEEPISNMVASITKDKEGVVTCLYEARHGYEDGDHITFAEKSIKVAMDAPEFLITDFAKFDRPGQLHIGFQADADEFLKVVKALNEKSPAKADELDKNVMREMAYTCRGDLCPLAAIMGGVAAQEVMKACSGKFHPVCQYMYFDALECLPEDKDTSLTEENCKPYRSDPS